VKYIYTDRNLLNSPHKYTYSQFGGISFMEDYILCRSSLLEKKYKVINSDNHSQLELNIIKRVNELLSGIVKSEDCHFSNLIPVTNLTLPPIMAKDLQTSFPNKETVDSFELLDTLLTNILIGSDSLDINNEIYSWLNALVQRFEVTKKLWSQYLPGFRKGQGVNDNLVLYQYFSLILAISYYEHSELQYLSTLLKVNDLLLSLDYSSTDSVKGISCWGLGVLLEVFAVKKLQSC